MFNGTKQHLFKVVNLLETLSGTEFVIAVDSEFSTSFQVNECVCINGCLFYILRVEPNRLFFNLNTDQLRTSLGKIKVGDWVGLDLPCKYGDTLSQMVIKGQVCCQASIKKMFSHAFDKKIWFELELPEYTKYLIPRTLIAVDGIGLSILETKKQQFSVIIPNRLSELSIFKHNKLGHVVNIEFSESTIAIVETVSRALGSSNH